MIYVLTRVTERHDGYDPFDNVPIGAYASMKEVQTRLDRISAANWQYPMKKINNTLWSIGPEEDDPGFFGQKKRWFAVYQVPGGKP
jgi:hypothetical protein